ncbi:MAG: CDP-alcohol phosphatidyltransferase family protein, partial [Oscillospiraceae bacterium]
MNTANKLTMLRLALIPVFLVLLYQGTDEMRLLALAVFV